MLDNLGGGGDIIIMKYCLYLLRVKILKID